MKFINYLMCLFLLLVMGCSKDDDSSKGEKGDERLTKLVPQAFLDEAKEMGFEIHTGNNPPVIGGDYKLAPWRFDGDNHTLPGVGGTPPGYENENGFVLQLSEQNGTSLRVRYVGYYEGIKSLSEPFVMGSGNNFTIVRHFSAFGGMGGLFTFPYAELISGTKDGDVLRNVQMASIGLKAEHPNEAGVTVEGNISIRSDSDGVSPLE